MHRLKVPFVFLFIAFLTSEVKSSSADESPVAKSASEIAETRFRTGEDMSVENFRKIDIKVQLGLIAADSGYMVIRRLNDAHMRKFFEDDVKIYQKVRALLTPEQLDTLNALTYSYSTNLNPQYGFPKGIVINGVTYSSLQEMRDNLWKQATQNDPRKMNAVLCKNLLRMAIKIQSGESLNIKKLTSHVLAESENRLKAHGANIPQTCTEVVDGQQITFGLTETIHVYKMESARKEELKRASGTENKAVTKSFDQAGSYCTQNEVTNQVNQSVEILNSDKKITELGVFNIEKGCRLLMYLRKQKAQWKYYDYAQGMPTDQIVGVPFSNRQELIAAIMTQQSPLPKFSPQPAQGGVLRPAVQGFGR